MSHPSTQRSVGDLTVLMQSLLLAVVGLLCLFSVESVMSRSRRGKKVDYKALHEGTTSTIGRIMDPEVQLLDYDDEFVGVEASASVSREQDMSASGNGGVSSPDETTESEKGSGEEFDTCGDGSEEEEDPDIRCADEEIKELRRQIRRERKQRLLDRKNQEIEQLRQELSSIRIRDQEQETGKRGRRQVRGIKDSNKMAKKGINMSLDVDLRELRERNKKSGKAREMWCEKSESSEFDEGDSCGEDEEVEVRGKQAKSRQSGIKRKSSDSVRFPQKYPHHCLQFEYVSQNIQFNDLSLKLFIAGELEIISGPKLSEKERKGRTEFLKRVVYYSNIYEWKALLSWYAAWLRKIEIGERDWSDNPASIEIPILARHVLVKPKMAGARTQVTTDKSSVWFCSPFQRNKCPEKGEHEGEVMGIKRHVLHICATCWRKDKTKRSHPESSQECPFHI